MVGVDALSYWNGPFLGDILVFGGWTNQRGKKHNYTPWKVFKDNTMNDHVRICAEKTDVSYDLFESVRTR